MYAVQFDVDKGAFLLIDASRSVLVLIDLQTKLAPAVADGETCLERCRLLLAVARWLSVPVIATEHCPESVGRTVERLRDRLESVEVVEKRHFNAAAETAFGQALAATGRTTVLVAGMEAHVCVLQTVLGLKGGRSEPMVVADAIASRRASSRGLAIERMRHHGVDIVDSEMVIFEWLRSADAPAFKDVLPMIKSGSPD